MRLINVKLLIVLVFVASCTNRHEKAPMAIETKNDSSKAEVNKKQIFDLYTLDTITESEYFTQKDLKDTIKIKIENRLLSPYTYYEDILHSNYMDVDIISDTIIAQRMKNRFLIKLKNNDTISLKDREYDTPDGYMIMECSLLGILKNKPVLVFLQEEWDYQVTYRFVNLYSGDEFEVFGSFPMFNESQEYFFYYSNSWICQVKDSTFKTVIQDGGIDFKPKQKDLGFWLNDSTILFNSFKYIKGVGYRGAFLKYTITNPNSSAKIMRSNV